MGITSLPGSTSTSGTWPLGCRSQELKLSEDKTKMSKNKVKKSDVPDECERMECAETPEVYVEFEDPDDLVFFCLDCGEDKMALPKAKEMHEL